MQRVVAVGLDGCPAYGLAATGTMAHSYIKAFPGEEQAFRRP